MRGRRRGKRTSPATAISAELVGRTGRRGSSAPPCTSPAKSPSPTVPQLAGLDGSNELTVEAWVLWEAGGRYPNILTGGQWSPGGFPHFVHDKACSFRMGRPGARPGEPAVPWTEASAALVNSFETGKWYHLTATFKRPQLTTYLNGARLVRPSGTTRSRYRGDLRIGTWNGGPSCHKGLIDEVKIFSRALSAEEVQAATRPKRRVERRRTGSVQPSAPPCPKPLAAIEIPWRNWRSTCGLDAPH